MVVFPFAFALACILQHWMNEMVQLVEKWNMHCFELWDVSEEENTKNDEDACF